ncbi:MAG: phytoene/squalene synthase family protein [Gammaproteobacteria bacterium]
MSNNKNAAIVETSRLIIQRGSKSFAAAAKLFDLDTRDNAYMLYAWCRYCDDQIDNQTLGFDSKPQSAEKTQQILDELREQTQAAIDNKPSDNEVFEALRYVLHKNEIPGRYALELLDGFAMDAQGYEYETLEDTLLYCYYVAGVVGIMMAYVMHARDEDALQRAIDLGIAFQLTNISRDVREDAETGRVYLPREWLEEAGIPREEMMQPQHAAALSGVVERLLNEADRYYASANEGLRALGFRSAWAVAAARGVYSEIGHIVRDRGENAWQERVIVRKRRKLLGLANGMFVAARSSLLDKHKSAEPRAQDLWTTEEIPAPH